MNWFDALRSALGIRGTAVSALAESRSKMRIHCGLAIVVTVAGGDTMEGKTHNVNSKGLTVEVDGVLRRGQKVGVLMRGSRPVSQGMAVALRDLHLQAAVVWTRRHAATGVNEAGLEFISFEQQRPEDILSFLRHELAVPVLDDKQKRKYRRIHAEWTVEYATPNSEKRRGIIKDISPCGLLLHSKVPLLLWTELGLSIQPDTERTAPIRAQAVVRRCSKLPGDAGWEIACPLTEMTDQDRNRLIGSIEQHLLKVGKKS